MQRSVLWKIIKYIAATIAGIITFVVVFLLTGFIISFLGGIPIIGSILYFPSDASWALIVLPAAGSVFAAAHVSAMICDSTEPICIIIAIFYIVNIIFLLLTGFSWRAFAQSVIMIISSVICLVE